MNPVLIISLLVTLFVSFSIVILLTLSWRKKKRQHREFERLLDDIKERQEERSNKLTRLLAKKHNLAQTEAQDLTKQLIIAEKSFLQQFIDQQLQQSSVEHFYEHLCELLDNYLNSSSSDPNAKPNNTIQSSSHNDGRITKHDTKTPAQDWGDVFD